MTKKWFKLFFCHLIYIYTRCYNIYSSLDMCLHEEYSWRNHSCQIIKTFVFLTNTNYTNSFHMISALRKNEKTLIRCKGLKFANKNNIFNPFATYPCVVEDLNILKTSLRTEHRRNMSLIFSRNSEAFRFRIFRKYWRNVFLLPIVVCW